MAKFCNIAIKAGKTIISERNFGEDQQKTIPPLAK
jgi:hypothetical protein